MRILIPTILAVLAIVCVSPAALASTSVPFNGSASGTFAATSPTTVALAGTGHYEHLGATIFTGTSTTTGGAACGGFTAMEKDTYTAANGDKVFLTVVDSLCPTSTAGVFHVSGTFTVTGGTGRFADASGSGAISATATFQSGTAGTFSGSTAGTISY
jgi:hypothetical protein